MSALQQYAPAAASLFNNMKTPASIIAGSVVPLGFLAPLPPPQDGKTEGKLSATLRKVYLIAAVIALSSELLAVMWATVAVNQLTETVVAPAKSVWDLLSRDYELSWAATNAHFLMGMFAFMWLIGSRAYLSAAGGLLSKAAAGISLSGLLLMVSVVNRGVERGGGDGMRYGATIVSLFRRYAVMLVGRSTSWKTFGCMELASVVVFFVSIVTAMKGLLCEEK